MRTISLFFLFIFSLSAVAASNFTPLQREAVRFMIEDSGGRVDGSDFVKYLRRSHVLTKKELKKFPELIAHKGFHYVQITLDDGTYDSVIVVIDPAGKAVNALYIDTSLRNH